MKKRQQIFFLPSVLAVLGLLFGVSSIQAQPYPSHPIQLGVLGAPGDAIEIAARSAADELAKIPAVRILF